MVATDRASPRDVGWASMGRTIRRTALFAARLVARRVMTGVEFPPLAGHFGYAARVLVV